MEPPQGEPSPANDDEAERLFAEYLDRLLDGERLSIDEYCARHPEHAEALRRLEQANRKLSEAWLEAPREGRAPSGTSRSRRPRPRPAPGVEIREGQVVGDYRLLRYIDSGGMGQVWEAEQLGLQRRVALKLVRPELLSERKLELFAREARAGGRLEHPGIVRVHAFGREEGLAWIATELVEDAWTLRDSLEALRQAEQLPREHYREVARITAEVAEAMQAAHDARVIHRDLKPQNILLTADEHPKVGDFGLARLVDEAGVTMTGEFVGTYYYMSPEQAMAGRMGIDYRTDVFSLGVVLYELLTLRRPFEGDTNHQIAAQIVTRDPPDPRALRSRVPRDLAVICLKSLEKDPDRRFQRMAELAADLRRYLADEPIRSKPPSAPARVAKWARRNPTRSVAAGISLVAFASISALLAANVRAKHGLTRALRERAAAIAQLETRSGELEAANQALAAKTAEAEATALREKERADEVFRLAAMQDFEDLAARAERLWPPHPEHIRGLEEWIARARALADGLPGYRAKREELRAWALPLSGEERQAERERQPEWPRLQALASKIAGHAEALESASSERAKDNLLSRLSALEREQRELQGRLDARGCWRFAPEHADVGWWNGQLTKLIDALEGMLVDESGLLGESADAISPVHGWSIPRRLAYARELEAELAEGGELARAWHESLPAIAERYPDLALGPQMGLRPIGPDPDSGLWEFAHLASGEPARRGADGRILLRPEMGLVLVLLPGGVFRMGAQAREASQPQFDLLAIPDEGPVHEVELSPFFISKYEMTQDQYLRLAGDNPSLYSFELYQLKFDRDRQGWTGLHPVERLAWTDCTKLLQRFDLTLPSEAQWEYACRAGSAQPWWCGSDPEGLQGAANLADAYASSVSTIPWPAWERALDDGHFVHAEVGSYRANPFGLHDVHGNVQEWCLDGYDRRAYEKPARRDPLVPSHAAPLRVLRGGSFYWTPTFARSSFRVSVPATRGDFDYGVRPARRVATLEAVRATPASRSR